MVDHIKRRILDSEFGYNLFSMLVGAARERSTFIGSHVWPYMAPSSRILDIGCGTGEILDHFPTNLTNYVGIDNNADYIAFAKNKYPSGKFYCADIAEFEAQRARISEEKFDIVIMSGVLHHLSDELQLGLFSSLLALMKPGARLVTIDGVFLERGQSRIAQFLLRSDRGKYVRIPSEYRSLLSQHFLVLKETLYDNLLNVPYDHIVFELGVRASGEGVSQR